MLPVRSRRRCAWINRLAPAILLLALALHRDRALLRCGATTVRRCCMSTLVMPLALGVVGVSVIVVVVIALAGLVYELLGEGIHVRTRWTPSENRSPRRSGCASRSTSSRTCARRGSRKPRCRAAPTGIGRLDGIDLLPADTGSPVGTDLSHSRPFACSSCRSAGTTSPRVRLRLPGPAWSPRGWRVCRRAGRSDRPPTRRRPRRSTGPDSLARRRVSRRHAFRVLGVLLPAAA